MMNSMNVYLSALYVFPSWSLVLFLYLYSSVFIWGNMFHVSPLDLFVFVSQRQKRGRRSKKEIFRLEERKRNAPTEHKRRDHLPLSALLASVLAFHRKTCFIPVPFVLKSRRVFVGRLFHALSLFFPSA